jgi:glucosamine--fructose-6-phosphate aminotransferase (isomerizing)
MCGITGYIGYQDAVPVLLGALNKLEYRGYDSAGIAVLDGDRLQVRKAQGPLSVLRERISGETLGGSLGIGHTRWATHGEPSDINSHPHTDVAGRIAVVHNGIIENYVRLREWLQARDVVLVSDTDTEVIAHLINYYYTKPSGERGIFAAVRQALRRLEGSYALAVAAADFPDRIIAVRKDSPLVIGLGKGENLVASDVPALLAHTREVCYPEDRELVVLYRDHADFFTGEGERIIRGPIHVDWDVESAEKGGFEHFMLKEIHEEGRAFTDTLRSRLRECTGESPAGGGSPEKDRELPFPRYDIDFEEICFDRSWITAPRIVITACGTAWHAGMVAKYALEHFTRLPVEVDIASEFRYCDPVFDPADLFIVISQSGETADTLAAMRLIRRGGGRVLAITNVAGSTLAREADQVLYTRAGPEIAVASTKAFTSQLMCLYLLALKLARLRSLIGDGDYDRHLAALKAIPAQAETVLAQKERIQRFASRQFNKGKVFFVGRQFDYAVSLESALKLKEINYTHSEAFAAGELKHGPIALVDRDTLVVTIATQTRLFDKIFSNIREAGSRGASSLVITWEGEERFTPLADEIFPIPKTEDVFSPLLSVIPAQLFAYYCAVQRGNDPDKPRNLAKSVTVE